jgi:hypothetical protein
VNAQTDAARQFETAARAARAAAADSPARRGR